MLGVIQTKGKYVALDLSACDMTGVSNSGEFDPGTANTGELLIVSLVLPGTAVSINAGGRNSLIFRFFTSLRNASGTGVLDIGSFTFTSCKSLEVVNFPLAETIGDAAFQDCTALKTVDLPAAKTIDFFAFGYCGLLAEVSLPVAETIGDAAFGYCAVLVEVDLPAAENIDPWAFIYCTSLKTVNLPKAETIGNNAFQGCPATVSYPEGMEFPVYVVS
ncbi:MAG: leucine-rich repeat domain-containing protein [Treponema sp.]|nr:leucine-rich repeat domain-containing protein [Treponema sp.]